MVSSSSSGEVQVLVRPPDDQQPSLLSVLLQRQVATNKNNIFDFDLSDQEQNIFNVR